MDSNEYGAFPSTYNFRREPDTTQRRADALTAAPISTQGVCQPSVVGIAKRMGKIKAEGRSLRRAVGVRLFFDALIVPFRPVVRLTERIEGADHIRRIDKLWAIPYIPKSELVARGVDRLF